MVTIDELFSTNNTSLFYGARAEIDLARARLKADEQMCWYGSYTCPSATMYFGHFVLLYMFLLKFLIHAVTCVIVQSAHMTSA